MSPTGQDQTAGQVSEGAEDTSPPGTYRLITPLEWYRIPLASEDSRNRSVRALVDRTCPNRDEDAARRRELAELIGNLAWEAAAGDGLELYLSTQAVLGVPVPASLVTTVEAPDESGQSLQAPPDILAASQQQRYPRAEVTIAELAAGTGVRVRRQDVPRDAHEMGLPHGRTVTQLTYLVPVPESGAQLVLAFSTPVTELADGLVEMFDAIARSLRWE